VAKWWALTGAVKGCNKPIFTCLSNSSHGVPTTLQDIVNIFKIGPMIAEGPVRLWVRRQNPPVGSASPRENRVRDKAIQGMARSWNFLGPHQEDPMSSSFVSES
jgi:hypothetical protein